ncbi:MAG: GNAT family N-acetyltransferase [Myxococcota bacterium]|nr:GNAT family N-acetyltransferase [Myxococcota bacterium]
MNIPISLGTHEDDAAALSRLINLVYASAEAGMWKEYDGAAMPRTSAEEVQLLLSNQRLLLARHAKEPVGCVCVQMLSDDIAEFGLLVAHPELRGKGIGRDLVTAAENYGRERGARVMQLELLTPKDWEHPVKRFLHRWYTRIGYVPIRTEPFARSYGHLADHLSTPCNFTVYHKGL